MRGLRESDRAQRATSLVKALVLLALVGACLSWRVGGGVVAAPAPCVRLPRGGGAARRVRRRAAGDHLRVRRLGRRGVLLRRGAGPGPRDPARADRRRCSRRWRLYLLLNAAFLAVLPMTRDRRVAARGGECGVGGVRRGAAALIVQLLIALALPSALVANTLCRIAGRVRARAGPRSRRRRSRASTRAERRRPRCSRQRSRRALFLLSGTFERLIAICAFLFVASYSLSFLSVFVLRRREPSRPRRPGETRRRPSRSKPRSKPDQRSPSASAFSRRSKLPSLPPRLSTMCTSVASRVHGTTGLPCSSCPWWRQDDVEHAWAVGGEAVDLLDLAAHDVVAERDLALELAGVGQLDRAAVVRVGLDLADVVEQRAGDRELAVDRRERRRRARARPARPTGCARAARAGRPGGSAWPPAPRGSAPRSRVSAKKRSSSSRRNGFWTVSISSRRSASIWLDRVRRTLGEIGGVVLAGSARRAAPDRDVRAVARRPSSGPRRARRRPGSTARTARPPLPEHGLDGARDVPSWSFRNGSPLRFWRRVRSRTTKKLSTACPSARSRTKVFDTLRACCSIRKPR